MVENLFGGDRDTTKLLVCIEIQIIFLPIDIALDIALKTLLHKGAGCVECL